MSANDIQIVTIIVPNPKFDQSKSARIINSDLGYSLRIATGFQTLSSNNPNNYDSIEGLLYLPTLAPDVAPACADSNSTIPVNVTTIADFPPSQDYPLTAIFPWTDSVECTEAYLAQARADAVRGALTFQLGRSDAPDSGDQSWTLRDGGHWKSDNQYPIYAVSSAVGIQLLNGLALYSGNMTSVPNGAYLAQQFDPRDFPRLFAHVDLQGGTNVPSLWIFLIIVLAVLLGIVITASIVMHIVQRHQRNVLQRRLERGEVDLESLGIKKINVPQHLIDSMPKYTFTSAPEVAGPAPPAAAATGDKSTKRLSTPAQHQPHTASFSQTTCPICLDDFTPHESEVRELPCRHIFHPECIDLFLRDNSSLCPMCKKSALPAGYCPVKVTNLMVRRERLMRRMRERRRAGVAAAAARAAGEEPPPTSRAGHASRWFGRRFRAGVETTRTPPPVGGSPTANSVQTSTAQATAATPPTTEDVELGRIASTESQPQAVPLDTRRQTMAVPVDVAAQGPSARRAWRRERLARQQDEAYHEQEATARQADVGRPLWRRVVGRVVPGFD